MQVWERARTSLGPTPGQPGAAFYTPDFPTGNVRVPTPDSMPVFTGAVFQQGKNGIGFAQCISCPGPIYTDEARYAKFQGVVDLDVVVTPEGKAANIIVVRGPGMGLEKRAIEAVSHWRFTPAVDSSGVPVAVKVPIEVTFKLY